jgi:hypothetical protein
VKNLHRLSVQQDVEIHPRSNAILRTKTLQVAVMSRTKTCDYNSSRRLVISATIQTLIE